VDGENLTDGAGQDRGGAEGTEGAEGNSARSVWLWVSAFVEGIQRTGRIGRTGQARSRRHGRDGKRGGEFRAIRVAPGFRRLLYWSVEEIPRVPLALGNLQPHDTILFAFSPRSW
jgi:hypothetical protein